MLTTVVGELTAVHAEYTVLRSPSPDALTALTANLYERPPTSPSTSTDDESSPRYASVDTAALSPPPLSLYSTYSLTVSPPSSAGAVHCSVMLPVVCATLPSPDGAPGDVDCVNASLGAPVPAARAAYGLVFSVL